MPHRPKKPRSTTTLPPSTPQHSRPTRPPTAPTPASGGPGGQSPPGAGGPPPQGGGPPARDAGGMNCRRTEPPPQKPGQTRISRVKAVAGGPGGGAPRAGQRRCRRAAALSRRGQGRLLSLERSGCGKAVHRKSWRRRQTKAPRPPGKRGILGAWRKNKIRLARKRRYRAGNICPSGPAGPRGCPAR